MCFYINCYMNACFYSTYNRVDNIIKRYPTLVIISCTKI